MRGTIHQPASEIARLSANGTQITVLNSQDLAVTNLIGVIFFLELASEGFEVLAELASVFAAE
jgi:calcineurin-like phosphoesterase